MTNTKPRVRKVAWAALGVVVVAALCFACSLVVVLSQSYTPWELTITVPLGIQQPSKDAETEELRAWLRSLSPGAATYLKRRHQTYPWLPGRDRETIKIEEDEYFGTPWLDDAQPPAEPTTPWWKG